MNELDKLIREAAARGLHELRLCPTAGNQFQAVLMTARNPSGPWTVAIDDDPVAALVGALQKNAAPKKPVGGSVFD